MTAYQRKCSQHVSPQSRPSRTSCDTDVTPSAWATRSADADAPTRSRPLIALTPGRIVGSVDGVVLDPVREVVPVVEHPAPDLDELGSVLPMYRIWASAASVV